jgi:hypothetical protein
VPPLHAASTTAPCSRALPSLLTGSPFYRGSLSASTSDPHPAGVNQPSGYWAASAVYDRRPRGSPRRGPEDEGRKRPACRHGWSWRGTVLLNRRGLRRTGDAPSGRRLLGRGHMTLDQYVPLTPVLTPGLRPGLASASGCVAQYLPLVCLNRRKRSTLTAAVFPCVLRPGQQRPHPLSVSGGKTIDHLDDEWPSKCGRVVLLRLTAATVRLLRFCRHRRIQKAVGRRLTTGST